MTLTGSIVKGTILDTVNLNTNSVFDCNEYALAVDITGSGTVDALDTDGVAVAEGVTVGSGVTMNFVGGEPHTLSMVTSLPPRLHVLQALGM